MRIVSGRLRGRNIATPSGHNTRPTSDQTRESIFNILKHAEWAPPLARLHRYDATKLKIAPGNMRGKFTHIFMDPPYNKGLWKPVLSRIIYQDILAEGGVIIFEESIDAEIEPRGFEILADKTWGAARVLFLGLTKTQ